MTDRVDKPRPKTAVGGLKKAAAFEAGIWRSLLYWVGRRPIGLSPGALAFGYSAAAAPVIWVFVVLSAVEIPLLHVLIPWQTARIIFLVLGGWGLAWILGLVASIYVHPHVAAETALQIRYSLMVDITVPWTAIATVQRRRRTVVTSRTVVLERIGGADVVLVAVTNTTNVEVDLYDPISVRVPKVGMVEVTRLCCYADDPAAFVAACRDRVGTPNSH